MQLTIFQLLLAFGLPWNYFLWLIFIMPHKNSMLVDIEEGFGILVYSVYGIIINFVLLLIITGATCLLE